MSQIALVCDTTYSRKESCRIWMSHVAVSLVSDTTYSRMIWLPSVRHDSFIWDTTLSYATNCLCITWLIHVQHDSFICDMTPSCATDSFIPYLHPHPYGLGHQAALGTFFFGVSSSPNLKHTVTYLLAYIILFFCVTFEEKYILFFNFGKKRRQMDARRHAAVCF